MVLKVIGCAGLGGVPACMGERREQFEASALSGLWVFQFLVR